MMKNSKNINGKIFRCIETESKELIIGDFYRVTFYFEENDNIEVTNYNDTWIREYPIDWFTKVILVDMKDVGWRELGKKYFLGHTNTNKQNLFENIVMFYHNQKREPVRESHKEIMEYHKVYSRKQKIKSIK